MADLRAADADTAATAALAALADEAWSAAMDHGPLYATAIGDRDHLATLAANDAGATERVARRLRSFLDRAAGIPADALADGDRATREALIDDQRHRLGLVESGCCGSVARPRTRSVAHSTSDASTMPSSAKVQSAS